MAVAYYILVRNHSEGFELRSRLREENIDVRIAPAPHGVQACCGMSLVLTDEQETERARLFIEEHDLPIEGIVKVENAFDPDRGRFC